MPVGTTVLSLFLKRKKGRKEKGEKEKKRSSFTASFYWHIVGAYE